MDRLSPLSTLADLLMANLVTVTLDNKKNGHRDTELHHDALQTIHAVHAKRQNADSSHVPSGPIQPQCNPELVCPQEACFGHPNGQDSTKSRAPIHDSMIWLHGYDLLRIGPHSLRASGAMQLKLNHGVSGAMVQKWATGPVQHGSIPSRLNFMPHERTLREDDNTSTLLQCRYSGRKLIKVIRFPWHTVYQIHRD